MRPRRIHALRLGPIVGHTDESSTRIWVQVFDDPALYDLLVAGVGTVRFVSTENGAPEFHTAIATMRGLRSDRQYRYRVLRAGRAVPRSSGTFRTMPPPRSMTNLLFCAISCNAMKTDGAWEDLARYVEEAKPQFLLMMGDQVYMDEDEPNVFENHLLSPAPIRRRAFAEQYRLNWSREPVRRVLANVPTYMMWDDHDIRDGWGSAAGDSPTLLAKYPRGAPIFEAMNTYFEDARDAYWHFQACRNPTPADSTDPTLPNYIEAPPPHGQRRAMPFVFRCGRLVVLQIDSRGDRDVFRTTHPVLGTEQWEFIERVFAALPADVEALAVVTPTPIASMDPDGQSQRLLGHRTDDVELFRQGDLEAYLNLPSSDSIGDLATTVIFLHIGRLTGGPINAGTYRLSSIDEVRDQWSHRFSRPEQLDLLRKAGAARLTNRTAAGARQLIFLSGDIHVGCTYDITSLKPFFQAQSMTSSGISNKENTSIVVGTFLDENVPVGAGIQSTLQEAIPDFNFGVVQVIPTGAGAKVHGAVAHEGNSYAFGLDFLQLL